MKSYSNSSLDTDFGKTSGGAGINGAMGIWFDSDAPSANAGMIVFRAGGKWYKVLGTEINP